MRLASKTLLLPLSFLIAACGEMPASYDPTRLSCGSFELQSVTSSDRKMIQVMGADGPWSASDLTAQAVIDGSLRLLPVSTQGCIAVPPAANEVRVLSFDQKSGLRLASSDLPMDSLHPVSMRGLKEPSVGLQCAKDLVSRANDLGIEVKWGNLAPDERWQIVKLRAIVTATHREKSEVVAFRDFPYPQDSLALAFERPLEDGNYKLRLEVETLANRRVYAGTDCDFELDKTPPEPLPLLASAVSNGKQPMFLSLRSDGAETFYCISAPDSQECDPPVAKYSLASEFIRAPEQGMFILHSYSVDRTGNQNDIQRERFFRDSQPPALKLQWKQPTFLETAAWARRIGDHYRLEIKVDDDAVSAGFLSQESLESQLQCRVVVSPPVPIGDRSWEAYCDEGTCQGKSLKQWTNCAGEIGFRFRDGQEIVARDAQIIVEVKAADAAQLTATRSKSFWINPDAFERWREEIVSSPFQNFRQDLEFHLDSSGTLWAVQATDGHVEIFKRTKEQPLGDWLSKPPVKSFQDLEMFAEISRDIRIGITDTKESLTENQVRQTLWLWRPDWPSLAAFDVCGQDDKLEFCSQNPRLFRVPENPSGQQMNIKGLVRNTVQSDSSKLLLLVGSHDPEHKTYALMSFDGHRFKPLGQEQTRTTDLPFEPQEIVAGTDGAFYFVVDGKLARFSTTSHSSDLDLLELPEAVKLRDIRKDVNGRYYGLTTDFELYTAESINQGESLRIQVLANSRLPDSLMTTAKLLRTKDNKFWLWGNSWEAPKESALFMLDSRRSKGWESIAERFAWSKTDVIGINGFGHDPVNDQLFLLNNKKDNESRKYIHVLRQRLSSKFMRITEQELVAGGWLDTREGITKVSVAQDSAGQLWQLSVLNSGTILLHALYSSDNKQVHKIDLPEGVLPEKLLSDARGQLWVTEANRGGRDSVMRIFRLNQETGTIADSFTLDEFWTDTFFDSENKFWGVDFFGKLKVRHTDGSVISLAVGQGNKVLRILPFKHGKVLAEVNNGSKRKRWEIDLQKVSAQPWSLDFDHSQAYALESIVQSGDQLLALIGENWQSGQVVQARIYEYRAGSWQAWGDSSLQHRPAQALWPQWSSKAAQPLTGLSGQFTMFFEPKEETLWIAGNGAETLASPKVPVLARVGLSGKTWEVFDPQTHPFGEVVVGFFTDSRQNLFLQTKTTLLYSNQFEE